MKHMNPLAACTLMVALALCLTPAQGADARATGKNRELVACLADGNPPFSSTDSVNGGADAEVARTIGKHLYREVRISWVTIPSRGGFSKSLRQSMAPSNCDLFLGIPVSGQPNEDMVEQRLDSSDPYIFTGYVLVAGRQSSVRSLNEARKATRVGVVTATPADFFLHTQHFNRVPYGSNKDLLNALSDGKVDAGVIWLPALANARQQGFELWPGAVRDDRLQAPGLETHFVIAMRSDSSDLKAGVNSALVQMSMDGSLANILQRHGITPMLAKQ